MSKLCWLYPLLSWKVTFSLYIKHSYTEAVMKKDRKPLTDSLHGCFSFLGGSLGFNVYSSLRHWCNLN